MKTSEFQKLLFKSAVTMMAIDGEIHDSEKSELVNIVNQTPYFLDFEIEAKLNESLTEISSQGSEAINELLQKISNSGLDEKQELILIDVVLRVLDADKSVEKNEVTFLKRLISRLHVNEETLISRFPRHVQYFIDINDAENLRDFALDVDK